MNISKIELENFRNYSNLSLKIDSDISVFFGENGQGKTNILESVYLCSCLRSHRTSKDTDLIKHDAQFYKVKLKFFDAINNNENFEEEISVLFMNKDYQDNLEKSKRVVIYNDSNIAKNSEIIGIFNSVIFAPEDLNIIKEGPSTRRRYLDLLISQIRASYFNELVRFQKILSQRNSLLKQMRDGKQKKDYNQILVWDIAYANSCKKIISTRFYFTKLINEFAAKCHSEISYGKEEILVKYKTITGITSNNKEKEVYDIVLEKLKTNFLEDIEKGNTSYGPHRDDIEITINNEILKVFASQGQQRTAVLSLKIAELEIIKSQTGKMPVLLLDDVLSELDKHRREKLLLSINDAQVLLTCTEKDQVEKLFSDKITGKTIKYYEVKSGFVNPL